MIAAKGIGIGGTSGSPHLHRPFLVLLKVNTELTVVTCSAFMNCFHSSEVNIRLNLKVHVQFVKKYCKWSTLAITTGIFAIREHYYSSGYPLKRNYFHILTSTSRIFNLIILEFQFISKMKPNLNTTTVWYGINFSGMNIFKIFSYLDDISSWPQKISKVGLCVLVYWYITVPKASTGLWS